ncbi:T9SS type A sorting domain-containing protein [Cryomorpha ignava]|uniref:T9SS type A sorting domain-containing protein n=1 Tax=Cryomorpha ignava TaxID=101383 RepID=A0A7K3WWL2_9FLAO|nr:kelch repeat-containing protein [Cryomorpha ignava]NEN25005.1 T9SS type A sorting domain-containing protein [Cryomorpha ignava]
MSILIKQLCNRKIILSYIAIICVLGSHSQSWIQVSDFPSTERDDGASFVIDNTAYCGTGLQVGWSETKDFYAFSMNADTWEPIASLPDGNERQYASGFSSSTHGFVFGGVKGGVYLSDLWQYDPELNNWVEKSSLPAIGRSGSACFVIDNVAYIIGGKTNLSDAINEVWAYEITNDTWQQKNDLPFGSMFRASASANNGKGYLIFGKDENNLFYNELYEYDPISDSWTELGEFPNFGRSHSTLSSLPNNLIVIGGVDVMGDYYNDMWRFNLNLLIWEQLDALPSFGRKGGICFNDGTNIYYTTGISHENVRLKETWKSVNPTAIEDISATDGISIYPNPTREKLTLEIENFSQYDNSYLTIFDYSGKRLRLEAITQSKTQIDVSELSQGFYFIQIQGVGGQIAMKFVKQ